MTSQDVASPFFPLDNIQGGCLLKRFHCLVVVGHMFISLRESNFTQIRFSAKENISFVLFTVDLHVTLMAKGTFEFLVGF